VTRVLHVRDRPGADVERQVVLDAGMTELIRPALYGARHEIEHLRVGQVAPEFELPKLKNGGRWRRWIDTALESPNDIVPWQDSPEHSSDTYRALDRSVVMLYADA